MLLTEELTLNFVTNWRDILRFGEFLDALF